MATLELPWAAFDAPTLWYRLPSVKVAFVVSLLLHAAAIVLLPNLRVPEPKVTPPLIVELVPPPPPPPVVQPEVQAPPPPVVKATPKPVPPPPAPEVKPEPKPEPPPIAESRTPPPPQPIAVPPRPVQPEPQATAPVRVEPPPPVHVEPPAQPQAPPQPPALDTSVLRDYSAIVSGAVAKKQVYPRMALMRRWQGTANLKLEIAADGNLKALSVKHSSGFEILDDQAMKMVKQAMPLPALPDSLRGREFVIDIPVAFKLQD
jgi:protein TonB